MRGGASCCPIDRFFTAFLCDGSTARGFRGTQCGRLGKFEPATVPVRIVAQIFGQPGTQYLTHEMTSRRRQ